MYSCVSKKKKKEEKGKKKEILLVPSSYDGGCVRGVFSLFFRRTFRGVGGCEGVELSPSLGYCVLHPSPRWLFFVCVSFGKFDYIRGRRPAFRTTPSHHIFISFFPPCFVLCTPHCSRGSLGWVCV